MKQMSCIETLNLLIYSLHQIAMLKYVTLAYLEAFLRLVWILKEQIHCTYVIKHYHQLNFLMRKMWRKSYRIAWPMTNQEESKWKDACLSMLVQDGIEHLKSLLWRDNMTKLQIFGALVVYYMNSSNIQSEITIPLIKNFKRNAICSKVDLVFHCLHARRHMLKLQIRRKRWIWLDKQIKLKLY